MAATQADNIFICIFLNENDSDSIFTEICSQESNWQKASIGSGNGLAPNRRQAITWTNADPVHWRTYAALGGDELSKIGQNRRHFADGMHFVSRST